MMPDVSEGGFYAFLAGLVVSPHCVGMCGPLFCGILRLKPGQNSGVESFQSIYHLGRLISYVALGAAAGFLSLKVAGAFEFPAAKVLPWAMIIMFLLFAFNLDWIFNKLPKPRLPLLKLESMESIISAFLLGLLTPLLPCAPLYSVFWVALISGSPTFGAEIMAGFCLGTIPLLWLGQSQFMRLNQKISPGRFRLFQRILALAAALIIAVRVLFIGNPFDGSACLIQL